MYLSFHKYLFLEREYPHPTIRACHILQPTFRASQMENAILKSRIYKITF
jgi:hypothetical protein